MTKRIPCTCAHEYQDRQYGPGIRLHNETKTGYRCTVCKNNKAGKVEKKTENTPTGKK